MSPIQSDQLIISCLGTGELARLMYSSTCSTTTTVLLLTRVYFVVEQAGGGGGGLSVGPHRTSTRRRL